ncbi:MAG: hypothetical protein AB8C46_15255 [Burkholderiaceae bacterium]
MLNRDRESSGGLSKALFLTSIVVAVNGFFAVNAQAGLTPITAICFKTLGDSDVCLCASDQLASKVSADSMMQYESLIALALAQTNVPRAKAWRDALGLQAKASGTSVREVQLSTEATGREHNLAVQACQAMFVSK